MSLQATIIKLLLKLPPSWLVRMSGGKPVEIGGRTLDPYFQFIAHGARNQPGVSALTAQQFRQASADALAMLAAPMEPGISAEDVSLKAPGRDIPARLYRPADQNPEHPILVYMHMGGGVIGDLETCHAFCSLLSDAIKAPVLSVEYRLAPEHKFPAGLDDCLFAYDWALKNAQTYGAPPAMAAIGGDSMGGNFAAIIAQESKRQQKPVPALQLLIYPATDIETKRASHTVYGDCYPLTTELMDWFMGHYLNDDQDQTDPRISPALAVGDLANLPPAIVATAGFDPLVDDGEAYAKALKGAGVPAEYVCYDSLAHGFTAFMAVSPAARKACEDIAARLAKAYADLKVASPV
ncbi:MAG: alpha/beta hydrolase [Pseudomonadota bacterium]